MKKIASILFVLTCFILAWIAWNPPSQSYITQEIHLAIPNIEPIDQGDWRVVTKRMVWKKAVDKMMRMLHEAGFEPLLISKSEPIELHAFDDARYFQEKKDAYAAKTWWEKHHVDADVLKISGDGDKLTFHIALGRYYIAAYADQAQKELEATGRPYRYEKRMVVIPSYRFAFPVMPKSEAEILWKQLQNMGVADPVLMQNSAFEKLYAINSEKRSNR